MSRSDKKTDNTQHATCTGDITLRGREKISHLLEANIVIIGQLTNFFFSSNVSLDKCHGSISVSTVPNKSQEWKIA